MSEVKISADLRTEFGKGGARRTRRAGKVPAVLYGHGEAPKHIALPAREFAAAIRHGGMNQIFNIALADGSLASRLYGQGIVRERHRHRYEVNNDYLQALEKKGLRVSGIWAEKQLVEMIEIPEHPYFVAGQFHPEFRSRPWDPHPLFAGFVRAALAHAAGTP